MNHIINQNEYKDSPVGRIPAGWTAVELNDLGVFQEEKEFLKTKLLKKVFLRLDMPKFIPSMTS